MIDTSIVATSLHSIGNDFEVLEDVNWVALAYTLAYLGCAIVFSRISDIVGRRAAFIAAYIIFFVFSLACGFAQSLNQLIAFRALQGVGGSGMYNNTLLELMMSLIKLGLYALTMIMMPELSPDNLKQHMAALVGLVITVSGVLGPVLGGLFTHYASWRWVFWIKYNSPQPYKYNTNELYLVDQLDLYLLQSSSSHGPSLSTYQPSSDVLGGS